MCPQFAQSLAIWTGDRTRTAYLPKSRHSSGHRFSALSVPLPLSPAGLGKLIAEETEKWGKVVKFAGIKSE